MPVIHLFIASQLISPFNAFSAQSSLNSSPLCEQHVTLSQQRALEGHWKGRSFSCCFHSCTLSQPCECQDIQWCLPKPHAQYVCPLSNLATPAQPDAHLSMVSWTQTLRTLNLSLWPLSLLCLHTYMLGLQLWLTCSTRVASCLPPQVWSGSVWGKPENSGIQGAPTILSLKKSEP